MNNDYQRPRVQRENTEYMLTDGESHKGKLEWLRVVDASVPAAVGDLKGFVPSFVGAHVRKRDFDMPPPPLPAQRGGRLGLRR
jgi:hypothetical protein